MLVSFIILIITLSIDFFVNATVAGYFQQKSPKNQIFQYLGIPVTIVLIILSIGLFIGHLANPFFADNCKWYAATVILMLALKLFYNGLRMHSMRLAINPLNKQGMLTIITFMAINAFFVGIAGGLVNLTLVNILYAFTIFSVASILGYLIGLRIKKLIAARIEFLAAVIYLITAIVLVKL